DGLRVRNVTGVQTCDLPIFTSVATFGRRLSDTEKSRAETGAPPTVDSDFHILNCGVHEGLAATPPAIRAGEARLSSRQRTVAGNSFSSAARTSSADSSPRSSEPRSRAWARRSLCASTIALRSARRLRAFAQP